MRVWGRGKRELTWRVVEVHATQWRNVDSRSMPYLFRGTCIAWTSEIVAVGWDFATALLREQMRWPASREHPVEVLSGRLHNPEGRLALGGPIYPTCSEILAHECGHTWQARRMSWLYWPIGAAFTLWREGPNWYNHFENQASAQGLFGGIVTGSIAKELLDLVDQG
jgi:hypothetical protein